MLIDEVFVNLKAGHGGPGKVSFYPGKKSGPDGGNGGKGGDIYIQGTSDMTALNYFSKTKEIAAEDGKPGDSNRKFGRNGTDTTLLLPVGTEITDLSTGKTYEVEHAEDIFIICKGGHGGRGNFEFKSSRNTTPQYAQPGLPGQESKFKLELKLIARFGLIGLPNAGKSSLLNELTAAKAKTADYPFTTLEPNLGVLGGRIIADIPGLIKGASEGKGLGIKFLKHIEKVSLLLHCLSAESDNIYSDYQTVINELKEYNPDLLKKRQVLVITKTDLIDKEKGKELLETLKPLKKKVYTVSIHDWESIQKLKKFLESA